MVGQKKRLSTSKVSLAGKEIYVRTLLGSRFDGNHDNRIRINT